eukprot:Skav209740  [mRNA]  locus=scaffold2057:25883:26194:- [translate_table: standard]
MCDTSGRDPGSSATIITQLGIMSRSWCCATTGHPRKKPWITATASGELRTTEVFLKVEAATDGRQPLPGFVAKTLEFVAGDGFVCDALECAMVAVRGWVLVPR